MIALDTNLLVYAHRQGASEHAAAKACLERAVEDPRGWGIPFPCLAEFWGVVTHPACAGGASGGELACSFIECLLEDGGGCLWHPDEGFGRRLLRMAADLGVSGPRIFDLQIGLLAFENDATELWTQDRHFVRLPGLKVVNPF